MASNTAECNRPRLRPIRKSPLMRHRGSTGPETAARNNNATVAIPLESASTNSIGLRASSDRATNIEMRTPRFMEKKYHPITV